MTANAYYPYGTGFTTLNVTGTYVNSTLHTLFLNALNVMSGGLVAHATQTGGTQTVNLTVSATSSINVASGGSISVAGRGFPTATGPGAASTCSFGACRGGSHGGLAGVGSFGSGGATIYGSVTQPTTHGSGGGNDTGVVAGLGGGTMRLITPGTLTVAGTISAAGTNGPSAGGGGAGGSVWIETGTLTGGGTITASAGNGGTSSGQSTGGGGGGRMALYYATDTSTGTSNSRPQSAGA